MTIAAKNGTTWCEQIYRLPLKEAAEMLRAAGIELRYLPWYRPRESDRDTVIEGKSAFAPMGMPGFRTFAENGVPGVFRRQSAGLYRLVWYRWILSVSLGVSIEYTCGSGMQLKWEILQDV